jgi:PAS domain S-box-containing protein
MMSGALPERAAAEGLLEYFFEQSPDAILISDDSGMILRANAELERAFGYSRTELLGQPVELLIPERFRSSHPARRRDYGEQRKRRLMGAGLELFGRRKDGSEFPVDIMLSPIDAPAGSFVLCAIRDISEKKLVETALKETEQRFRLFIENVRDYAIFQLDTQGRIKTWNDAAKRMKGYSSEEIIGQHFSCFYTPEDLARGKPELELQAASEAGRSEEEGWRLRKDGSRFWAHVTITPIRDRSGTLLGFAKITRDFTERKKTDQELKKQAALLELAHDSIIVRDLESRILFWNRGAEEKYGWGRQEVLGKVTHSFLQTTFPRPFAEIERELHEQHYWEGELVHTTKSGREITVASRWVLQCDAHGKPTAIFEINNDITERKQAEHALKRSEEHARMLFEFSPDAVLVCDAEGGIREANARVETLFGYGRGELVGQPVEILVPERFRAAHPKHRHEYVREPRLRPMGAGLELFARHKNGSEFPVDILLGPVDRPDGRIIFIVVRDLSERKRYEEALRRSEEERRYLEEELTTASQFEEIIGSTRSLKRVLKQVETVASTDATALILGETGTGKELIARAIHRLSPRRDRPFVKLNCSAIPAGLLESELFGHEKGAFTGAIAQKVGRLELAHQGTLFLDEIGDLPLELQPKILRALQEQEFERLGGTRTIPVNVRLIAATNRNLAKMVEDREFRSDLYYRLKVFPLEIPPLRERVEDIPLLVKYFVSQHARRMNRHIETIPPEIMKAFMRWRWPGNVRELENFIERAVILSPGSALRAPLAELEASEEPVTSTSASLHDAERDHILRVLREAKGMISGPDGAAKRLGLKRTTLNSKLRKLGIKRSDYI